MILAVAKSNKIIKTFLPDEIAGDYVLKDNYGNLIGNVVGSDNQWTFFPNKGYQLFSSQGNVSNIQISEYDQFAVKSLSDESTAIIYSYPNEGEEVGKFSIKKSKIVIGSTAADIVYTSPYMKPVQATITYDKNRWYIESGEYGVFVNNRLIRRKRLDHGDIIFIYGLKLLCISSFIVIINLVKSNNVVVSKESFDQYQLHPQQINDNAMTIETEKEVFEESDYFLRSPRFKTSVKHADITISPPPEKEKTNIKPAILIIGPQLTMMLTSFVMLYNTLSRVMTGSSTFASVIPNIIVTVVMMISMFLWPTLTRRYDAHTRKKNELKRVKLYRKYLNRKEKEINDTIHNQKQILIENNVTLEYCQQIIYQRKRNLWEKTIEDHDYLTVRVGTGFVKPDISINYTEEDFTMEDDFLKDELKSLIKKFDYVEEAPLNISLIENRITAVVGNYSILQKFMESILLQIMTFHIYDELKILIFTDENKVNDWNYIKFLPHCWDNQKENRFIAANINEKKKLSSFIESVISEREESLNGANGDKEVSSDAYKKFKPYYLIITDDINECRNLEGIKKVLEMKGNLGFSMLIKHDRIANLPSQCSTFINVTEDESGVFKNELEEQNQQRFKADLNTTINVEDCVQQIANIPVKIPREKHELPKSIGFLEMYNIGNVEQFNSSERWKNNNPVVSLAVPVGIDQSGELFNMDIHEKAYGPHGLVAGTTGSGKSEWIITYILSLAVNFDPNEVQFVLIDYKGGGLAGSFVNEETGMRLPHLVGTITNLDKSEIRRSLASIESESKRRQRLFNEAREKLNDSSMNIYKYQQYYRKGMIDEPLSHLLIISDEFAELKSQEPEFLNQLVSIARIGRSLGIHLILATQKPSGVVDEQMWSNSRFKVCLRVQDKSDSNEMLKCDDAAYLKQTGAFYLQVGMNEFFGLGQSAYAGVKYKPTNIVKKKIETSLDVINRNGEIVNTVDLLVQNQDETKQEAHGEELLNIIMYLSDLAKKQGINPRKLWLDAIPENIYVDNLKQKYGFKRIPFVIEPIIGEFDDPYSQKQDILKICLNDSNVFVTGLSGSGKEKLLQSMIYSIITSYTPQEVNLYLADFGAETLTIFKDAPHVGDLVYINNKDKIENMIRFVKREYKDRKKRYREYGGNFESYNKYSEKKDPVLCFIINGYENLKEEYTEILDSVQKVFLECVKYGIVFVIASVDTSLLRGKSAGAFSTILTLKVANDDYGSIFGRESKGIVPKDIKGRGLFKREKTVYEYQTSSICDDGQLQQYMKKVCVALYNGYKYKVREIPMIPSAIDMDVIPKEKLSVNSVITGYLKSTIEPHYTDIQKNFGTVIIGTKKSELNDYCKILYRELDIVAKNTKVYLFDNENLFRPERYKNITYVNSDEVYNTMKNLIIYVNGEREKYNALEDKSQFIAKSRSVIVFHNASQLYRAFKELSKELKNVVETSRELQLFDFIITDVSMDFKDIYRDQAMQKILMETNGVLIGNSYENQLFLELSSRDIKQKDALPEYLGYIVENGKAYMAQMLKSEPIEIEEDDI